MTREGGLAGGEGDRGGSEARPAGPQAGAGSRAASCWFRSSDEHHGADDEPGHGAEQAARATFWPVLSAFERSTESVPSTTQNECCTPRQVGDEHREAQARPPRAGCCAATPSAVRGARRRAPEQRTRCPAARPAGARAAARASCAARRPRPARRCSAICDDREARAPAPGSSGPASRDHARRRLSAVDAPVRHGADRQLDARSLQLVEPRRAARSARRASVGRLPRTSSSSAPRSSTVAARDLTARRVADRQASRPVADRTCVTIALSQRSSSTRRTTVRPAVLSPVGRYGVARNAAWSAATAPSARSIAASCSAADGAPRRRARTATSGADRAASARQAAIAAPRSGSRAGAGHSSAIASERRARRQPPAGEPLRDRRGGSRRATPAG